jgi:hypothetical protein
MAVRLIQSLATTAPLSDLFFRPTNSASHVGLRDRSRPRPGSPENHSPVSSAGNRDGSQGGSVRSLSGRITRINGRNAKLLDY